MVEGVNLALSVLVLLVVGGLSAYLKAKADNFAMKEDFNKLLEQQKQTTKELEEIKTSVTHDLWLKQRRWEARREIYGKLLTFLHYETLRHMNYFVELRTPPIFTAMGKDVLVADREKLSDNLHSLIEMVSSSSFLVSDDASKILDKYIEEIGRPRPAKGQEELESRSKELLVLTMKTGDALTEVARREFGEERVSSFKQDAQ